MLNSRETRTGVLWRLVETAVVTLVYYLLAKLGQYLAIEPGNVTPIWPASGFAVGAVMWLGYRRSWLGIGLGNFLGNTWAFVNVSSWAAAARTCGAGVGIAASDILAAFLAAYLIKRLCQDGYPFNRIRDVVVFFVIATVASLVSATGGVTLMATARVVAWDDYCYTWLTWYLGHGVGVLVVAPAMLTWPTVKNFTSRNGWALEAISLLALTIATVLFVFTEVSPYSALHLPIAYIVAIPLIWAAFRFNHFGVALLALVILAIAVWGTVRGYGPFHLTGGGLNESLLLLQLYAAHTVLAIFILAAALTERQRAEREAVQSEAQYRDLCENTRDLIQSVRPDGTFIYVNDAWKKTLGYSDEEVAKLNIFDVIHPDSREHCQATFQQVMQGEALDCISARFVAKDGSTILVEGNSSCRFENGRPVATRGVFHDVTEHVLAQGELSQYAARLEKSNEDLQQFAYIASHDLQEPLRAVSGFCQLLARKYQGQLDENATEYIDHIVGGARRMQTLLGGLLSYSRVQTAGKAFQSIDCNEVVAESLANLRTRIEESDAQIECEPLPRIRADAAQLVQLFQNLVGNAIKYRGDRRPQVKIWAEAKGDEWVFAVRDNGIGIDAEQAERIFIIFQRLHARDEYPGTGMGLAICKRIVERHQGRIWVESQSGHGSTFYFSIPISLLKTDESEEEENENGAALPEQ